MTPWGVASLEDPTGEFPKEFVGGFPNPPESKNSKPEFLSYPTRCKNYTTSEKIVNLLKSPARVPRSSR